MFGLFKSKKSLIRQSLEQCEGVRHTWFEWTLEGEVLTPSLVVEYRYELDPGHPEFERQGLDLIRETVMATDRPRPIVRIVPLRASD